MKIFGKRIRILCFLLAVFLSGITAAAKADQVFDQAGLLHPEVLPKIEERTEQLTEQYRMNFVIVTTSDAEDKDAKDYADDFYMDQGFYDNEQKGGAAFLIDMDNREVWISTAGDMIYYLTDDRIEDIIDAGYEELQDGRYASSFVNMLERTADYLEGGIDPNQYTVDTETGKIVKYRSIRTGEAVVAFLFALAAAAGAAVWVIGSYRMKWGVYKYSYESKSSMDLYKNQEQFVNQIITSRHIPKDPPPTDTGGGGGSMSSTHTSSGGGTFGGGGRSF